MRLAYRRPSAISSRIDARASRAGRPGDSSLASVTITARKLALFTKNAGTTPKRPITTPATAGPTMRAALNAAEFSATALATSSLPTRSITYDWRAGWSKTLAKPSRRPSTATCQYSTRPVATSAPSSSAWQASVVCVMTSNRRFGSRSATAPVTTAKSSTGENWRVEMRPSLKGEPVSWSTSHACATVCIQPPTSATSCAK